MSAQDAYRMARVGRSSCQAIAAAVVAFTTVGKGIRRSTVFLFIGRHEDRIGAVGVEGDTAIWFSALDDASLEGEDGTDPPAVANIST